MRVRTQFRLGPFQLSGFGWIFVLAGLALVMFCCCGLVGSNIAPSTPTPSSSATP